MQAVVFAKIIYVTVYFVSVKLFFSFREAGRQCRCIDKHRMCDKISEKESEVKNGTS